MKEVAEKAKAISAAKVQQRVRDEEAAAYKVMMENKAKYEEGVKARDKEMREERMKAEEEANRKKNEHKERVRKKREEEEAREKAAEEAARQEQDAAPPTDAD